MMKPFNMPSVGGSFVAIERAFAPSSLPPVMAQRGVRTAQGEYMTTHEWNEEGASEVGKVVGAVTVLFAYFAVKALRGKSRK